MNFYEDTELENLISSNFLDEMLEQETLDEIEYDDLTFGDFLNSGNDF